MNKNMKRNIIIAGVALVLIIALILVVVLVPWGESGSGLSEIDLGTELTYGVTDEGMHTATVKTNDKGELENNSYGTLLNYKPAQIDKISMSTQEGNYTFLLTTPVNSDGTTEATVYTLEGFEDYSLQATNPSLLASAVCFVEFTQVADVTGENAAEYGFDNPRAVAKVYYNDGTNSELRLGDDAPGGTSCYIQFGDNDTVYVANLSELEPMLLSITDLFSTSVNTAAYNASDDSFDKITLGGSHLSEEVVITANTEGDLNCYYLMTSHGNVPVNTVEGSNIVGNIRNLTATEVVCVNPDAQNLKDYGLSTPFATVKTTYTYTNTEYDDAGNETLNEEVKVPMSLMASEADSEGNVYLMEEDGKLIYKIAATSVAWATTSMDKLRSEYLLNPVYTALESVTVKAEGNIYTFKLATEQVPATDEDGNETTEVEYKVTLDSKEIDSDQFYIMYQDLTLMEYGGADATTTAGDKILTVTYNYLSDRESDTVVYCETDTQKVIPFVNGERTGYVYSADISAIISNISKLISGKEIASIR
ncbi:MAG: DUF4340 domain-containing protein [Ruminococcus sp.]|nr:DUF4340 domain-containing protein [Ruminococcus sp.]